MEPKASVVYPKPYIEIDFLPTSWQSRATEDYMNLTMEYEAALKLYQSLGDALIEYKDKTFVPAKM